MRSALRKKPYIIGISGCSGSGKTFFVHNLLKKFKSNEIAVISQDNYYINSYTQTKEENRLYNFDLPTSFHRETFFADIKALIQGKAIEIKEYTFNNPSARPQELTIYPAPILLIEGLFIYYYEEINKLLDYRIFLDTPVETALNRRLKRDSIERGYDSTDVLFKWNNHVLPAYQEFLLPYKNHCHLLIENTGNHAGEMEALTQEIYQKLKRSGHL